MALGFFDTNALRAFRLSYAKCRYSLPSKHKNVSAPDMPIVKKIQSSYSSILHLESTVAICKTKMIIFYPFFLKYLLISLSSASHLLSLLTLFFTLSTFLDPALSPRSS